MDFVTKHHPHDYLPAAGHDALLPCYDLISRLLGIKRVHEALIAQAELADGHRVLEIGCGTGNLIIRAKRGHPHLEAIGCDPDPRALERARRKASDFNIRFERGYAATAPYADVEFDRVLSSMMLHHLDDDAKTAAAAEIFRVLRPGGRLHLVDIGGNIRRRRPDGTAHQAQPPRGRKPRRRDPSTAECGGFDCTEVASHAAPLLGRLDLLSRHAALARLALVDRPP